jgi:hypothetical protein
MTELKRLTTENLGDRLRLALTYNHKAIALMLKEFKAQGLTHLQGIKIPKLNSSKVVFETFLIDALSHCTAELHSELTCSIFHTDLNSYIETAIWSSNDDKGDPLDRSGLSASKQFKVIALYDCVRFTLAVEDNLSVSTADIYDLTGQDSSAFYHDLWLTRNGHGCGYWEPEYKNDTLPTLGDDLTHIAKLLGECDLDIYMNEISVMHTWNINL